MIKVVNLYTPEQQAQGLIGLKPIPTDTIWVFHSVKPGTVFHSRGVLENFDIECLNNRLECLGIQSVHSPDEVVEVPPGTSFVVESALGVLFCLTGDAVRSLVKANR